MNKLPDLEKRAALRRAGSSATTSEPPARRHAHGARLIRRFVRDPRSGRLVCVWSRNEDDHGDPPRRAPLRAA